MYRRYAIVAESDLRDAGTKLTAALGTMPELGSLSDNSQVEFEVTASLLQEALDPDHTGAP